VIVPAYLVNQVIWAKRRYTGVSDPDSATTPKALIEWQDESPARYWSKVSTG
jgi:hypothetical protein